MISIKDVNNILEKYELGNSGKAVAIEILQYYQVDEKICIVILIETILHVRYVMKLLSDKWICVEEEEKRSEFSELLRGNGLPVPQKYKVMIILQVEMFMSCSIIRLHMRYVYNRPWKKICYAHFIILELLICL